MRCEICGVEIQPLYEVIYKGRRGLACPECIDKYGLIKVKHISQPFTRRKSVAKPKATTPIVSPPTKRRRVSLKSLDDEMEYVENYGDLIKRGREALGLTQADLARELRVKVSYIKKVEAGILPPTPEIARRLEKILNVKLFKEASEEEYMVAEDVDEDFSITLGDLIRYDDKDERV